MIDPELLVAFTLAFILSASDYVTTTVDQRDVQGDGGAASDAFDDGKLADFWRGAGASR